MQRLLALGLLIGIGVGQSGCALITAVPSIGPPPVIRFQNPTFIPLTDRDFVWTTLVDVVDDDFVIHREQPVQVIGDVLTEGRLETKPTGGATIFEPWRGDSVTGYDRAESTLQSIRRTAFVRVLPTGNGLQIHVTVLKELQDVKVPARASASGAIFRHDSSLRRFEAPVGPRAISQGWIPLGNDFALEQQIIGELRARLGLPPH